MSISARRLLLVDEDRDFAESLADLLELSGYEVEVAYSGDEAIHCCREKRFDLRLPQGSALEVFRELERLGLGAPIVVISSYLAQRAEAVCTLRGRDMAGLLEKPFQPDELLSILATIKRQEPQAPAH